MKFRKFGIQSPSTEEKNQKQRYLFIILVIFMLFSTAVAGIIIAENSKEFMKSHLHTVVFDETQRKTHLSGQILYQDGSPYQNGDLELHSQILPTTTDQIGRFFYPSVESGTHTLLVLQNRKKLAECAFSIQRSDAKQLIDITKSKDSNYLVEIAVDVRFIELGIEIDKKQGTLKLIPEKTVVLTDAGIVSINGKTMNVEDGTVILPSTTIILPDKTVVAKEYLVLPENSVIPIPDGGYEADGNFIRRNGTILLEDGTKIENYKVIKPDGSVIRVDTPYQIIDHASEKTNPSQNTSSNTEASNSGQIDDETPADDTGKIEYPDPAHEEHLFADQFTDDTWTPWSSLHAVSLFDDRTNTASNGAIQPGSKGSYSFRLRNDMKKALRFQISVTEKKIHIPMRFRLINADGNKGNWQILIHGKTTSIGSGIIKPGMKTLSIEWEWLSNGGHDQADTEAGSANRDYSVDLLIHAVEKE